MLSHISAPHVQALETRLENVPDTDDQIPDTAFDTVDFMELNPLEMLDLMLLILLVTVEYTLLNPLDTEVLILDILEEIVFKALVKPSDTFA